MDTKTDRADNVGIAVEQDPLTHALRRAAQRIAALVVAFGGAVVVAWLVGAGERLVLGSGQVPIAPGTGLLCIGLGAALLGGRPGSRFTKATRASQSFAAVTLILAIGFFSSRYLGFDLAFERWLSGTSELRNGIRIGRTALTTALLFGTVSIAVLLRGVATPSRVQSGLLSLVLSGGIVILQGYALGAPLLYDGRTIPVAAPTALLVTLCSLSALLHLGPDSWPVRLFVTNPRIGLLPAKWSFLWLALLLSSIVITSGVFWYRAEKKRNEDRTLETLTTIVALKSQEIEHWYHAQRSVAVASGGRLHSADMIVEGAQSGASAEKGRAVLQWLSQLQRASSFKRVELFDAQRRSLAFAGSDEPVVREFVRTELAALPAEDSVVVSELRAVGSHTLMVLWTPLPRVPGRDPSPGAWVALVVDADESLFPLLADVPLDYETREYVLWQMAKDSLRMVRASQATTDPAERQSLSLSDSSLLPVLALRTRGGSFSAIDYRRVAVRGSALPIEGTQWLLVAKVNEAEISERVRRTALRATFITLFFLLGVAGSIYALWYRRDLSRSERELSLLAERDRGTAELRRNESRYARAMRGTSDGLWDWDFVTGEVFLSPRWREIVGVPETAEIHHPQSMFSFFDPADVVRHEKALARHLESGEPYDLEMGLLTTARGQRWIRTRGEAERDSSGRPLRMGGAITDISHRRITEGSLLRSERVLRVRSAVNQAIIRTDSEAGLYQEICDIAVQEGGFLMAWIGLKVLDEGRTVTPVGVAGDGRDYLSGHPISWGDSESGQGPTGRCIRTGTAQVAQELQSDPHFAPWREAAVARGFHSSAAIPLTLGNETIGAMMFYASEPHAFDSEELGLLTELGSDISFGVTALRDHLTLDAQREQLTLFRQVMDRSTDAIFVVDAAAERFADFNGTALEQLGYTDAELRALSPYEVVKGLSSWGGPMSLAAGIRASGGALVQAIHLHKDGHEIPVEVALSALDVGHQTLILAVARDTSERVAAAAEREVLQSQLTRAQRMESVGRLAGGIAHDFNNLLTIVTSAADLAMGELDSGHPVRDDLVQIRSAGERAARLTRQLLAFSRQQVLKHEVLDVNEVINKFLGMLNRVIGEDVNVEVKFAPRGPKIVADAGQLEQVLMNLCVNARDAMPKGGTLTIGTDVSTVDEEHAARREGMAAGDYAVISVADTGVGMDKQTQAKIFDPFFTTKEQGRGTGLGLATVYGIIKQSGGSIWCYSEPGMGTTFRIYLPLTADGIVEPTSGPTRSAPAGRETVLVVEDEDAIRLVARRVLERSGYTVIDANSGAAALELLAKHEGELDLVLTDLVMPGMTGLELAAELRSRRPDLKILFTSGYSADVVSDRFHPDGNWNFISKPYGVRELVKEVRRVLDS